MKTFWALMERDIRVLGRDFAEFAMRVIVQPFLFVFVFGYVLPEIGQVKPGYANFMLPGILASAMMMTGVLGTAIPLSNDFGYTREIEDRLMSPITTSALIAQKMAMGTFQAWLAGALVFPVAWLIMRNNLDITVTSVPLLILFLALVGIASASWGLALGTRISPQKIPLMFATIILPTIFLGATYYPWTSLASVPWLQNLTLINPMVYASEGFRAIITPQIEHINWFYSLIGLLVGVALITWIGVRGFLKQAYS